MEASNIKQIYAAQALLSTGIGRNVQITIVDNKITQIQENQSFDYPEANAQQAILQDSTLFIPESQVLLPGLVDSHVHVNDPGRNEWETFSNATRAAVSGGITTFADMPLNSIPSTVDEDSLNVKLKATEGNLFMDVGFIGGLVSGNQDQIKTLFEAGIRGFKCFLIHSGVDEFKHVTRQEALAGLKEMSSWKGSRKPFLMFHAELEDEEPTEAPETPSTSEGHKYETYLKTRPPQMENRAIDMVIQLCEETGVHCHIVHLSSAEALPSIIKAKKRGLPLTVETCFHYLSIQAENISDSDPTFKCCPPIRDSKNQDVIWKHLDEGWIDFVVSDHSPCTAELKQKGGGNFLEAWGGISSLSLGLPILWTELTNRKIEDPYAKVGKWLASGPSALLGLQNKKGRIQVGMDADFCLFNPTRQWTLQKEHLLYKNQHSPYLGRDFTGQVEATILRGKVVYDRSKSFFAAPQGQTLLN